MQDQGITVYEQGTHLFHEGDMGGDLFFINEGTIEIYKRKDNMEVILSEINAGEVVGAMSVLNKERRSASARATSKVKALVVRNANFEQMLGASPDWMKLLLNDLIKSLNNTNEIYLDYYGRLKQLEKRKKTILDKAIKFAESMSVLAQSLFIIDKGKKVVPVDALVDQLGFMLGLGNRYAHVIFHSFVRGRLLKVLVSGKGLHVVPLQQLKGVGVFGKVTKIYQVLNPDLQKLRLSFLNEELKVLEGVGIYYFENTETKTVDVTYEEFRNVLLDRRAIDPEGMIKRAIYTKILNQDAGRVQFDPSLLVKGARSLEVINRILAHDQITKVHTLSYKHLDAPK